MCCNDAIKSYTELGRQRVNPIERKPAIDKLSECVTAVHTGAETLCTAEYDAMKNCLLDNKTAWVKCTDLRKNLDLCLVKNRLGELSK